MSKSPVLVALVFLVLTTTAYGQSPPAREGVAKSLVPEQGVAPEEGVPPEHGVLYATEWPSGALTARTRDVSVRLEPQGEDDEFEEYMLLVETTGGQSGRYPWPDGNPLRPDELYLFRSFACDQVLIDVVVRSAPPRYAEGAWFSYDRYLIDEETLELEALVPSDPSIRAALAVLPIQTVTAPGARWPVFSVECEGERVESVMVRDEYGL
jgi:hypothetical protein